MAKKKTKKAPQEQKQYDSQRSEAPKYKIYIVLLILIITGLLIYSNTFHGSFAFDDYRNITENDDVKNNTIAGKPNHQRWIGFITFAINYHYGKMDTLGYHIVNITIHIINAFLVYLIIQKIMLILQSSFNYLYRREIPLIVALIFLVHPIQTQAINYIVQRITSLAALFALISILYYLKFRSEKTKDYGSLLLSLLACLLAYKTKENTATLPLIIIAIELLLFRKQKITVARILYVIPYFLFTIVIPLSLINADQPLANVLGEISKASVETERISRIQYLLTESRVISTYIRLLFLPINQSIDYYFALSRSFFEFNTLIAFCFISALFIVAMVTTKKYPMISLGLFWFYLFLAVESSIIPIKDVIFEHRLYLPSIGFIAAVVYLLFLIEDKLQWHKFAFIIFIAAIIALAVSTYYRNQIWKDEMLLWEDAATKFPLNSRAVGNYGVALANKGYYREAIKILEKATQISPKDSSNWYSLGFCYKMLGEPDNAIKPYLKALEIAPQYQKASVDLSMIYISKHQWEKAWDLMTKARTYYPEHPYNNALLAQLYCETDDLQKAMPLFENAVKTGLDYADMYFNFAICLINHRIYKESRKNFFKVIEFNSAEVESYYFIAVTYDREKDYERAAFYYKTFLSKATKSPWLDEVRIRLRHLESMGIKGEGIKE